MDLISVSSAAMRLRLGHAGAAGAPADAKLSPVDTQTLYERVYEKLSDAIMNGAFASGEILTIRGIAEQLGTSTMPAREALRRLATEGALDMLPNRSIRIPKVSALRIREICRLRALLEGEASARAALCRTEDDLRGIGGHHREFIAGMEAGSAGRVLGAGQRFHFAIYEAARLPTTVSLIRMLWLQSGPWLGEPVRHGLDEAAVHAYAEFVLARHGELLEALVAGEPGRAAAAVTAELDGAVRHLLGEEAGDPASSRGRA